jgi:hypothetical protein
MKRRRSILRTVAILTVFAIVAFPTLTVAVREVLHGRGADAYTNVYGLAIHYTSILILAGTVIVALAGAYIARVVYFWRGRRVAGSLREKVDPVTPPETSGR